jgi:hypothetical protein
MHPKLPSNRVANVVALGLGMGVIVALSARWTLALGARGASLVGVDFRGFYDAARIARSTGFARFDSAVATEIFARVSSIESPPFPQLSSMAPSVYAVYPPAVTAAFVPLTYLNLEAANLVFASVSLIAIAMVYRDLRTTVAAHCSWQLQFAALAAWGPLVQSLALGQNTAFTLSVAACAGVLFQKQNFSAAGFVSALIWWKPQYSVALCGCFVLARLWSAVRGWAVGALLFVAINTALGGRDWILRWPRTAVSYAARVPGSFRGGTASAFELAQSVWSTQRPVGVMLALIATTLTGMLIWLWVRRRFPIETLVLLSLAPFVVIAPHSWCYESALALPALYMAGKRFPVGAVLLFVVAGAASWSISPAGELLRVVALTAAFALAVAALNSTIRPQGDLADSIRADVR